MIINLAKYKPYQTIEDNALSVVEQIPGLVENHDQTNILRNGKFLSERNIPCFGNNRIHVNDNNNNYVQYSSRPLMRHFGTFWFYQPESVMRFVHSIGINPDRPAMVL